MVITLTPLLEKNKSRFISALQLSFKQAFIDELKDEEDIISQQEIIDAMNAPNAQSLQIAVAGEIVGGAVVTINTTSHCNTLELFYIQENKHANGIGFSAWQAIEKRYPNTKLWVTYTPYFEKRNVHFYVNKCGFKITAYFHPNHPNPHSVTASSDHDELDEMFRFEKCMRADK